MHWSDQKYINGQQMHFNIYNLFIKKILTSMFRQVFRPSS